MNFWRALFPKMPACEKPRTIGHDWSLNCGSERRCTRCYQIEWGASLRCVGRPESIVVDVSRMGETG